MAEKLTRRVGFGHARKVESRGDRILQLRWTDETYDDYQTVLLMDGWDFSRMFNADGTTKNAPFLYSHNWEMPPVGEILNARVKVETQRTLKRTGEVVRAQAYDCIVRFAKTKNYQVAHLLYDLYAEGIMRATSAGFWPIEQGREPTDDEMERFGIPEEDRDRALILPRNKLAEISGVTLPGNENAVKGLTEVLVRNGLDRVLGSDMMSGVVSRYSGILYPEHFTGRLNRIMAKLEGRIVDTDWRQAKSKVQSVIFSKTEGEWTADKARTWLDDHDFNSGKLDETEESFRFRQFDPADCMEGTIVTLTENLPAGISMVACDMVTAEPEPETEPETEPEVQEGMG